MMKYTVNLLVCFVSLFLVACRTAKPGITQSLNKDYERAIKDVMYREDKEIDTNLIAITSSNKDLRRKFFNDTEYVLVVTWDYHQSKYPVSGEYKTDSEIWVTVFPELLQRMQYRKEKENNLRLKQLLGLTPTEPDILFVEFWVNPINLFRPCPDKEITDNRCNMCFSKQDSLDENHIKWINNNRLYSYFRCGIENKYPWTALGYTYDWNPKNKTHKGLSEFVVRNNSTIYINRVRKTEEYLTEPF